MDSLITNITIATDDSDRLILVLITKQMYVSNLLVSLDINLNITTTITNDNVTVLIPIYGSNGAIEIVKQLSDNENWANIKQTRLWDVGYYQDERVNLVLPLKALKHADEQ